MKFKDKFVIFFFRNFFKYLKCYNYLIYYLNKNISLGKNISISTNAKIETSFGGSVKVGDNTEILDGVLISSYGGHIEIGSNCSINPYTIIYGHGNTKIGNNVLIAGHCMIIPNNHNFLDSKRTIWEQGNNAKGIVIDDDVWIGHACSVLDGVRIGKGAVVAAGSVVLKDIESYSVVAGVPASIIKFRE